MGAVVIFILLALLWVVLIVPRQREVRRHNALVASLEVGDEVMTGAGIYGTITTIDDDDVHIEIAPDVVIKMAKRAVGSKIQPPDHDHDDDHHHDLQDDQADDHVNDHLHDDPADQPDDPHTDGAAVDGSEPKTPQTDRTED